MGDLQHATDANAIICIQQALVDRGYEIGVDGIIGDQTLNAILRALGNPKLRTTGLRDPAAFFDYLRANKMLGPVLSQDEVDGCERIVTACGNGGFGIAWAAYALATAYHETAHTMKPVMEYGGPAYFHRMYDIGGQRPKVATRLGNTHPGDGAKYCGRGYVQLTGRSNYRRAGNEIGVALEGYPDLACEPDNAAKIMVAGMRDGWFTSERLVDHLPAATQAGRTAFANARTIINGTDRADMIADYAMQFQAALEAGKWA